MNFVDKQYYVAVTLNAFYCVFKPFFEVAAVLSARNHSRKVQGKDYLVFEQVRNFVFYYRLRKPLHHGAFTDARFAYQNGVVFRAARQNLYNFIYFLFSADYGVNLTLARLLGQIRSVLQDISVKPFFGFMLCGFLLFRPLGLRCAEERFV